MPLTGYALYEVRGFLVLDDEDDLPSAPLIVHPVHHIPPNITAVGVAVGSWGLFRGFSEGLWKGSEFR
jgi:hypothetical protein